MLAVTLLDNINGFLRSLQNYSPWQVALELLLIGGVVFWVVRFLQGTRGARLLRGIALLLISFFVIFDLMSSILDLGRIQYLYERFLLFVAGAIIVVFQPELRRALMRLGETRLFRAISSQVAEQIDALVESAMFCSRRKIGALIAIERDVGLGGSTENSTRLNAELTAELLNTIFWPNSPLHDLGVIVSQGRIAYAGVQFPLAESGELEKELGSRHRAAVGMSQDTDAIILVVSEESGDISIAERGVLYRKLTPEALRDILEELMGGGTTSTKSIVEQTSPRSTIIGSGPSAEAEPGA
ncbi:MAG: TIGR00159 family protein [Burkholderiales bacterium]|nr:TIGR00159 family protein [Phycisphaerae bacterium]